MSRTPLPLCGPTHPRDIAVKNFQILGNFCIRKSDMLLAGRPFSCALCSGNLQAYNWSSANIWHLHGSSAHGPSFWCRHLQAQIWASWRKPPHSILPLRSIIYFTVTQLASAHHGSIIHSLDCLICIADPKDICLQLTKQIAKRPNKVMSRPRTQALIQCRAEKFTHPLPLICRSHRNQRSKS